MGKNTFTYKLSKFLISLLRYILIFGFCYVILKPIVQYFFYASMSPEDFNDYTVSIIPRNWSLFYWSKAAELLEIFGGIGVKSLIMSASVAGVQVAASVLIGYGLGRFQFKIKKILLVFLIIVMLVPSSVLQLPLYFKFLNFGIGGLSVNMINTLYPTYVLSALGLGLKQALYIFLMRSMFMQLPDELENAAYIDGASIYKAFFTVILPNAKALMITVFLFSFCWTWTDTTYSEVLYPNVKLISNQLINLGSMLGSATGMTQGNIIYAGIMLMMIPMLVLMLFCQRHLVKSIALSGLAN